jgi:iron complex transport system substrate-binding protein
MGRFLKIFCKVLVVLFATSNLLFAEMRIVSVVPSITRQLIDLGGKDMIVGCSSFCLLARDRSSKAVVVGSATDVNVEAVLKLKPTIVIVGALTNKRDIEKLKSLGLNVKIVSYPRSLEDIYRTVIEIGNLTGRGKKAREIVAYSRRKMELIEKDSKRYPSKKVFMEIGVKPLFSVPRETYLDDVLNRLNLINIAKDVQIGGISKEIVLKANPDVILIMDMGDIGKEEKKNWEQFKFLNAVKTKKIFIIDADRLASPVLPDFIDLIEDIAGMVHR